MKKRTLIINTPDSWTVDRAQMKKNVLIEFVLIAEIKIIP